MEEKCPKCGSPLYLGRCVRFTQHKLPKRKKTEFIGHIVRKDSNIDREDTRPIEKKKRPNFSSDWEIVKKVINRE